ncbi:hypothetical protein N7528_007638 [Penicillium herquei]|nr:hypothetical protein N7528_007638 [Penicillium herquei]
MRSIFLLSIAVSTCSALVIPDQEAVLDTFWKTSSDTEKSSYEKLLANEPDSENQVQLDTESLWGTFASQVEPVRGSAIHPVSNPLQYDGGLSKSMKVFSNEEKIKDEFTEHDEDSYPGPSSRPPPGHPGHRPPHPGPGYPHHGPCDNPALCPRNSTIWELISQSHRTARLAEMIRNDDELVKLLSNASASYTLFAPTNRALDRLMSQFDLPSISNILRYHVILGRASWEDLHAYRHQTLATTLSVSTLGQGKGSSLDTQKKKKKKRKDDDDKEKEKYRDHLQRLRVDAIRHSVLLNGASEIIAGNIIASNGIIHHIDIPLTPPPNTSTLLRLLPEHFSTFTLALSKSNLEPHFDATSRHGGTTFAPTNEAFRALGPRMNGFLFSPQGEECLRALLEYHIVPDRTIYSDAIYGYKETAQEFFGGGHRGRKPGRGHHHWNPEGRKGRYPLVHVDSSTLLEGHDTSMDIMRQGWDTEVRINGFWEPRVMDLLSGDGVIHAMDRILIPPKTVGGRVKGKTAHEEQMGILMEGLGNCGKMRNPRVEL